MYTLRVAYKLITTKVYNRCIKTNKTFFLCLLNAAINDSFPFQLKYFLLQLNTSMKTGAFFLVSLYIVKLNFISWLHEGERYCSVLLSDWHNTRKHGPLRLFPPQGNFQLSNYGELLQMVTLNICNMQSHIPREAVYEHNQIMPIIKQAYNARKEKH